MQNFNVELSNGWRNSFLAAVVYVGLPNESNVTSAALQIAACVGFLTITLRGPPNS
jgi:hypothetical protein